MPPPAASRYSRTIDSPSPLPLIVLAGWRALEKRLENARALGLRDAVALVAHPYCDGLPGGRAFHQDAPALGAEFDRIGQQVSSTVSS